ncbi:cell division protein FtsZ [Candidatus Campbellbacteria bacterium CG22_combo_CG10-13_8_21_14_all_36_13]|uniref:Cell division protein FtsZ n=1 Tax=Candidatus Campbellbacteria bacterium CG22_combo_CG10-13_8_21_14_all_36_13 TaxID=1974529 RepID=A0A2H0DYI0_9BACT|nr:MAG: cell division protein FtsZ [Candidatus Campbellbacteria bacterium CG22_combo_CG10-13_8_21_14_all_36_13]
MTKKVQPDVETFARIKVVGTGGSGGNAINHMVSSRIQGVEFIAVNTDAQDLHHSKAKKKIHIGKNLTKGLGTGMNPELGKRAAEETKEEIQGALKGADMVFIASGMGGGTGTGASGVVAKTARELGALTVGVVTKPFYFEGTQRMRVAMHGLQELQKEVDALIVIPNDRLLQTVKKETSVDEAFSLCDEVLREAVEGISDLITTPGKINVDFADIRSVMENAGSALMGIGKASGESRSVDAARMAISSPLLDVSINGAKGVLFAIAGGDDLTMHEIQEAARIITESIDPNAKVIFGTIKDEKLKKGEVKVTVIASGFPEGQVIKEVEINTPLFPFGISSSDDKDKEDDEREKIYDAVEEVVKGNVERKDKKEKEDTKDDEDDDWGSVPSFLRRSKLK